MKLIKTALISAILLVSFSTAMAEDCLETFQNDWDEGEAAYNTSVANCNLDYECELLAWGIWYGRQLSAISDYDDCCEIPGNTGCP